MLVSLRGLRVKDDAFETLTLALSDFNDASPDLYSDSFEIVLFVVREN